MRWGEGVPGLVDWLVSLITSLCALRPIALMVDVRSMIREAKGSVSLAPAGLFFENRICLLGLRAQEYTRATRRHFHEIVFYCDGAVVMYISYRYLQLS